MLGTIYDNDLTPTTLNVEETVVIDQTNGIYVAQVDLANLLAGDTVEFRPYMKVRSGGTRRLASAVVTFTGVQSPPIIPDIFKGSQQGMGAVYYWELTIKQTAGTLRAFPILVFKIA